MKKSVSLAEQEMWKKSFAFFEKGMKDFEAIGDSTNTALLLCNTGRLMRICAQAHCTISADLNRGEFTPEEALYYNKVPCQMLSVLFCIHTPLMENYLPLCNLNDLCVPTFPYMLLINAFFHLIFTPGHRLLLEGYEVASKPREPPSSVGQCKLGAVHYLFHTGYTSAGLCPAVQEGPGAGGFDHILVNKYSNLKKEV